MSALKLNLADLQFVLRQIKIAEANSTAHSGSAAMDLREVYVDADGNAVPSSTPGAVLAIPDPHVPYGLRTVDGSYNSLVPGRELWGASDQPMPRLFDPSFLNDGDGDSIDMDGPGNAPPLVNGNYGGAGTVVDADPRTISNLVVDMTIKNPAAVLAALTFAGSEDPMADLAEIMALNMTLPEAAAAMAAAQAALDAANLTLADAVANFGAGGTAAIDDVQAAAQTVTEAEAQLAKAQAVAADPQAAMIALAEAKGVVFENGSISVPNVAPDEGLSAPFNAWMTFFGQFFDHGLDLISKGNNGTIYIPLSNDDPLVTGADGILGDDPNTENVDESADDLPAHLRFMALTRSTVVEGADGQPSQRNVTTPYVDQNQTYTSHASHQVFLREYDVDAVTGRPYATGRLLDGMNGGLATWADVKAQARDYLGIDLTDMDVFAVPLLRTDAYGEFIRDPVTGFPQLILGVGSDGIPNTADDIVISGTPDSPINTFTASVTVGDTTYTGAVRTNNAFLDDIAHDAVPGGVFDANGPAVAGGETAVLPDTDIEVNSAPIATDYRGRKIAYDDELLDRHYITGDGRGNENIGLTAVHHVFHSEHNRQVDQQRLTILQSGDIAFINEWLADDIVSLPLGFQAMSPLDQLAIANSLRWDGERLFQAARMATEMQYQHLVFEEFGRKIQPAIDPFVFNNITDVDPSIFSEFANVVYRFGHSMLTENVPRIGPDGQFIDQDLGLVEAFLNPVLFDNNGALSHDEGAAAVVRGMTVERGNEIDEFVVGALRNNLLGLPLDLAAINIARGRDTGMPTLNEARQQLFDASGSSFLTPYTSWTELAANLKNPLSVVNFIAAYGTHESITGTLQQKRDAAWKLVFGDESLTTEQAEAWNVERLAFLNSTGVWNAESSGLNDIDLWIGGLAEKKMPFGGMLGSTFNAVFELQMENLQDGDRFYYLTRTQGQNFLNSLEQNSFAKLIMANTNLALPGADGIRGTADDIIPRHIGVDAFATYDYVFEVNAANQADYDPENVSASGKDPVDNDQTLLALGLTKVIRDNPNTIGPDANYFRTFGGEHVVVGGTNGNDTIITDFGDDGIWGDAGDDRIESGAGVDLVNGGAGDDIITDSGDSGDFLKGDEGDDVIANSNGLDILMGGSGKDVFFVGVDATEVFAGEGDDFILGGDDADFLMGNEGNDWIEGGGGFDTTAGDNSELFFNSAIKGHDVMFAGNDEHDFDAESGDDIMVQGESVIRNEGMFGFDWSIFKGVSFGANADLRVPIFTTEQADILRNRFDKVEALSGWDHDDILRGDDRVFGNIAPGDNVGTTEGIFFEDQLTQAGVDRIEGLRELLGNLISAAPGAGDLESLTAFDRGNFLLGGGGSDTLQGNGGDDFIDGDAWLNVRIRITGDGQPNVAANEIATVDSLKHVFANGEVDSQGQAIPAGWVGKSLFELMISRTIKPNQLHIVREIIEDDGVGDTDTAIFNDAFFDGNGGENYTIVRNSDGTVTISHVNVTVGVIDPLTGRNLVSDGTDTLRNVEWAEFADGTRIKLFSEAPTDIRWNAITPGNTTLPGNGTIATLTTVDPDSTQHTYSLLPGSSAGFSVSAAGVVARTGPLIAGATYTLNIRSSDEAGVFRDEAFTIMAGSDGANVITAANGTDHIIYGDDGNDTLTGGAGNDTLFGQDENDTLDGGLGDDILHGGIGDTDTASYASASGSVTVNLSAGTSSGAAGNDTLTEIENVTGSGFDDTLIGNAGANILTGGAGADTLVGGTGNDVLQGGADNDTYVFGLDDDNDNIADSGGNADRILIQTGGAALASLQASDDNGGTNNGNLIISFNGQQIIVTDHYDNTNENVELINFDGGSFAGYQFGTGDYLLNTSDPADAGAPAGRNVAVASANNLLAGEGGVDRLTGGTGNDLIFGGGGNDVLVGGAGDDLIVGGTGVDNMSGGAGNDTIVYEIDGGGANETISGGADTDTLAVVDTGAGAEILTVSFNGTRLTAIEAIAAVNGDIERVTADLGAGTDTLAYNSAAAVTVDLTAGTASGFASVTNIENVTGGTGNDAFTGNASDNVFNGGAGIDRAIYEGTADDYEFALNGANIEITGAAIGTDTLISVEQIQIGATVYSTAAGNLVLGTNAGNNPLNGSANAELILGFGGNDTINGNGGADIIQGGDGNDTINGGAGDDIIVWHVGDDRDIVNGGGDTDYIVINGDATSETYRVYTRAAWDDVPGNNIAALAASTQIVITRGGTGNASIIAELTGIEEIVINTGAGNDQVLTIGDFSPTNLSENTITVNGGSGNDTVDISGLQSAHRILFRSNGGNDTIVGTIRPQDVIELAPGQDISTYALIQNVNGTSTFTNGTHSITFTGAVPPQFGGDTTPEEDEIDGAFEYTASDLAGLKALVNGLKPDFVEDDDVPVGYRELSGYGNNETNPTWGSADQAFIRLTQARYGEPDEFGNRAINPVFAGLDPREISNILGSQELALPKAGNDANIFFMAMGQYIDHGLDFLPKGGNGSVIIGQPGGGAPGSADPADLTRGTVLYIDEHGIPQHKNQTSPYVDQNQAYGSHDLIGQFLRESDGNQGQGMRLLAGADDPSNPDFQLLPTLRELIQHHWYANTIFTDPGLPGGSISFRDYYTNYAVSETVTGTLFDEVTGAFDPEVVNKVVSNFMGSTHPLILDANPFISILDHYVAGDGRANENFALTSIHTIWSRNHNHHVDGLLAAGFEGTAEEVFQAAKMINEAEYQRVVFDEYLETLLGGLRSEGTHGFEEYDPTTDGAISHEFASAVFRFGHSLIGQKLTVLDDTGAPLEVNLFDAFLNPSNDPSVFIGPLPPGYTPQPGYAQHGVSSIIGGAIGQPSEDVDFNIVDAVRNDLVRIRADLFAFNVARGWDVGLGTLNQVRMDLANSTNPYLMEAIGFAGGDLSPYASWADFQGRNGLSNAVIAQFMEAYPDLILQADEIAAFQSVNPDIQVAIQGDGTGVVKGIDRLDLWVGGLAEAHINGGIVGETFWVVLHEQFERLQDADRFYYIQRFDEFDFYQDFIDGQEFADIVARNTGMTDLPEHLFRTEELEDGNTEDDDDDDDDAPSVGDDEEDDDDTPPVDGDDEEDEDEDDEDDDDTPPVGGDDDEEDDESDDNDDDDDDVDQPAPVDNDNGSPAMARMLMGTSAADVLIGAAANDTLLGGGAGDILVGEGGNDILRGEDGDDVMTGGDGADTMSGGAGSDEMHGGSGADMLFGNDGADMVHGDGGNDVIETGAGDDKAWGGAGDDIVLATANDGNDQYWGDEGNDTLDYSVATGNLVVDLGNGFMGRGQVVGNGGTDMFYGFENFIGGSGHDVITATSAINIMDGGLGNDTFRFQSASAAHGDTIYGFAPGDKIDFSAMDANTTTGGHQGFTLNAGSTLTAAGQVAVSYDVRDGAEVTLVRGNVDGDPGADFELTLMGRHTLTANDFNGVS